MEQLTGQLQLLAFDFEMEGWLPCEGQQLAVMEHPDLSTLSSPIGGNESNAFRIPNLKDAGLAKNHTRWQIALNGTFPSEDSNVDTLLGEIRLLAYNKAEIKGWHLCDGSILPTSKNQALSTLIGNKFGGDNINFKLPDLRLYEPINSNPPVSYYISTNGAYPSYDETTFTQIEQFTGTIALFPHNFVPAGWALCNGQLLDVRNNQDLYS